MNTVITDFDDFDSIDIYSGDLAKKAGSLFDLLTATKSCTKEMPTKSIRSTSSIPNRFEKNINLNAVVSAKQKWMKLLSF